MLAACGVDKPCLTTTLQAGRVAIIGGAAVLVATDRVGSVGI